eukprot:5763414-Lingulodinium_polyedra.AAC.1
MLTRSLQNTLGKNPGKAGGRRHYVKDLFEHARRAWARRADRPSDLPAMIFSRRVAAWMKSSS